MKAISRQQSAISPYLVITGDVTDSTPRQALRPTAVGRLLTTLYLETPKRGQSARVSDRFLNQSG
jgi:hypothetical protein